MYRSAYLVIHYCLQEVYNGSFMVNLSLWKSDKNIQNTNSFNKIRNHNDNNIKDE